VRLDASLFVRFEIIAPGRVIQRRRFASVGFIGRAARRFKVSRFVSSTLEAAAKSLLFTEEPLLEEASSCDVHSLESLFGVATCTAIATRVRDGEISVAAVVADDRGRHFGHGRAVFHYGTSSVGDRWASEWLER
jgi:hypothetical protein